MCYSVPLLALLERRVLRRLKIDLSFTTDRVRACCAWVVWDAICAVPSVKTGKWHFVMRGMVGILSFPMSRQSMQLPLPLNKNVRGWPGHLMSPQFLQCIRWNVLAWPVMPGYIPFLLPMVL